MRSRTEIDANDPSVVAGGRAAVVDGFDMASGEAFAVAVVDGNDAGSFLRTEIGANDPSFVANGSAAGVDGIDNASGVASVVAVVDDDYVLRAEFSAHDQSSFAASGVSFVDGNKALLDRTEIDVHCACLIFGRC